MVFYVFGVNKLVYVKQHVKLSVNCFDRFRGSNIAHDRLVEDTGASRVDTYYKITFPDPVRDETNFDSGIENPSFECSVEDVTLGGNIVKYNPM